MIMKVAVSNLTMGSDALQEAAILGLLSFVMSLVVLIFFSSVLLNVVDAVFMCYAMDLDTQSVTKAEVHEVFSQVTPCFPQTVG